MIFKDLTATYPNRFSFYVSKGISVIPLKANGKTPVGKWKEYQSRPASPQELAEWDGSIYNIGIPCGVKSGSDGVALAVLDIDSPEAQQFVDGLELPLTPSVRTSRGRHLYFCMPQREISNKVHIKGTQLDVRGKGGYVVAPPSVHPDGTQYEWEVSPDEIDFAEFPIDLLDIEPEPLTERTVSPTTTLPAVGDPPGIGRFISASVAEACIKLGEAGTGTRNDTLYRLAVKLANHVAATGLSFDAVTGPLIKTALQIGLDEPEVHGTVNSAWNTGCNAPTSWVQTAAQYIYLAGQNAFMHVNSGEKLDPVGFNGMHGHTFNEKGQLSNFLLQNGYIPKMQDEHYDPRAPRGLQTLEELPYFNTYTASAIEAVEGDAAPFVAFMEHLVPVKEEREHLLRVMAHVIRNPGEKVRHAIILSTKSQGAGKSWLANIWKRLVGAKNTRLTSSEEIQSSFNGWLTNCTLCVCEELDLAFGAKGYNQLKNLITDDQAVVNEKYKAARQIPIFATFLFLTNLKHPMRVEDRDRRIFYINSPAPKLSEACPGFIDWSKQNLGIIRWYLDQIDLSQFNPHAPPPQTTAKVELIADSRSELARDILFQLQDSAALQSDITSVSQIMMHLDSGLRRPSKRAIAEALAELGAVKFGQVSVNGTRPTLWILRSHDFWMAQESSLLAHEYESFCGLVRQFGIDDDDFLMPATGRPEHSEESDLLLDPETGKYRIRWWTETICN